MKKNQDTSSSGGGCAPLYILGMPLAAGCSWLLNHSILWALFHGVFWWAYLPYICMGCGGGWPKELPL